jgi:HSP20 family molecular chaperone IbpA
MSNRDPRSWMWAEALELLEQADSLHRQFYRAVGHPGVQLHWEPPVDIVESANEIAVLLALPGVPPEQIQLQLDDGGILVRAARPSSASGQTARIRRLEIPYGCFERRIALPQGSYELVEQSSVNGILQLRLRKH